MSRNRKKAVRRAEGTTDTTARQFEGNRPAARQAKRKSHDAASAAAAKPKAE